MTRETNAAVCCAVAVDSALGMVTLEGLEETKRRRRMSEDESEEKNKKKKRKGK